MHDSAPVTQKHIERVGELLHEFCRRLQDRAAVHDASKFDPVEKGPLDEMQRLIAEEGPAPYGSEEYKRRTALLGPMLDHHYRHNSHHPEHYQFEFGGSWANGIAGMDLVDLVEMLCDWKAASERGAESAMNLSYSIEKHRVHPMLASIMRNTAERFGWPTK